MKFLKMYFLIETTNEINSIGISSWDVGLIDLSFSTNRFSWQNLGRVFNSRCCLTCLCHAIMLMAETAKLKVEKSAHTTFRISPISFRAPVLPMLQIGVDKAKLYSNLQTLYHGLIHGQTASKLGKHLSRIFNTRCCLTCLYHAIIPITKKPNLKLKTQP
jgi:hypothetical protein